MTHKLSLVGCVFGWSTVDLMDSLSGSLLFFFHKGFWLLIGFLCGDSFLTFFCHFFHWSFVMMPQDFYFKSFCRDCCCLLLSHDLFMDTVLSHTLAEYDSNSFHSLHGHMFTSVSTWFSLLTLETSVSSVPLLSDHGWLVGRGYIGGGWASRRQERKNPGDACILKTCRF